MIKILLAGIIAFVFGALIGGVLVGEYITYNYRCEKKSKRKYRNRNINNSVQHNPDCADNRGVHPVVNYKIQQDGGNDQSGADNNRSEL